MYSEGKVLAEPRQDVERVDYEREAVINPVNEDWRWSFRHGAGNEINTVVGRVTVVDGWGNVVTSRSFDNRTKRGELVRKYMARYWMKKHWQIKVTFTSPE